MARVPWLFCPSYRMRRLVAWASLRLANVYARAGANPNALANGLGIALFANTNWNLLANWLPFSTLHTTRMTNRRCLASPNKFQINFKFIWERRMYDDVRACILLLS